MWLNQVIFSTKMNQLGPTSWPSNIREKCIKEASINAKKPKIIFMSARTHLQSSISIQCWQSWCIWTFCCTVRQFVLHSKYFFGKMYKIFTMLLCKNLTMPKIGKLLSLSFCTFEHFFHKFCTLILKVGQA